MGRFSHRPTRLKRQEESKLFASVLMPMAWITGVIGLAGMGAVFLLYSISNEWSHRGFTACLGLILIPLVVFALRVVRGHYNSGLREP
ncbi:MAG: hypothetical protein ACOYOL_07930 [Chthoniobacterales bacterium]